MRIQLTTKDDDGVLIDPPALSVSDGEVLYRPQQTPTGWEWNLSISVRPLKVIRHNREMPAISDEHLHFG